MKTQTASTIQLSLTSDPFARVKKKLLDDPSISFTAKGIMAYLLGKKDGWKLRVFDLVNHSNQGECAIRTAIRELRKAGYIKFERIKENGRLVDSVWTISDSPLFSPRCGFPHVETPHGENHPLNKNEPTKKDSTKNGCLKETAVSPPRVLKPEIGAVWKPDDRTKAQMLAVLPVPRHYPSQSEFDAWVEENAPDVAEYRGDLYSELCDRKWRDWDGRANKWRPIRDWRKYVSALDEAIIAAKHS
jgi:hypothetical protein